MILFPNAKINIGLNVTGKRADGYHNLETVFYPVRLHDVIEVVGSTELTFSSSGLTVPGNSENNLCLKAYRMLGADYPLPPVAIHLHKHIPMGAGLGGGSADASFLIRLLNEKFELGLDYQHMENYAARLGADCPFFIRNIPVFAEERGDRFQEISLDLSGYFIVIVMPSVHVSTADAFRGIIPAPPAQPLTDLVLQPIASWRGQVVNDFEKNVIAVHPVIGQVKAALYQAGALYAAMSGSGAAVYGIFEGKVSLPELEKDNVVFYGV